MAGLHAVFAWLTVVATFAVIVAALPGAVGRGSERSWIDRAILAQITAVVIGAGAGLIIAVTERGPSDPLHFLYAAVLLTLLPGVRYAVHNSTARRFAGWIAVAALIAMGALLRSFMTGR